jgi:hypothetical protein
VPCASARVRPSRSRLTSPAVRRTRSRQERNPDDIRRQRQRRPVPRREPLGPLPAHPAGRTR